MPRIKVGQVAMANILSFSQGRGSTATTTTVSHQVLTGTETLVVTVSSQDSNDTNLPITGVTFGGVALTKGAEQSGGGNDTNASIWYLSNPSVSTADVVVTSTGSGVERLVVCMNVDGVIVQAPEATSGQTGNSNTSSLSITTLSDFAFIIECASHKGAFSSIGTGQTLVASVTDSSSEHNTTTYKTLPTAGTTTVVQTWASSNDYSHCALAFAPTANIIPRTTTDRERLHPYSLALAPSSGNNQRVKVDVTPTNTLSGLSAATMVGRIKINAVISGSNFMAGPGDGSNQVFTFKNYNTASNGIRINTRVGGANLNYDVPTNNFSYNTDRFYNFGFRYDGTTMTTWVDGRQVHAKAASGTFPTITNTGWWVNGDRDGGGASNINCAFFRVWTSALSDTNMINAMNKGYTTGAVIDLEFQEGSGTTTADLANNATVTFVSGASTPTWTAYESRGTAQI